MTKTYSQEFKEQIVKEATAVIRKLRNHPSIILWAGDNEVDACTGSLYDPNTNSLTREVLKKCVELNDIGRPYLPSSPYISPKMYAEGVRSQVPGSRLVEDHLWGPRDYFKSDFYTQNKAHFISECGYHGCPAPSSLKKFIPALHKSLGLYLPLITTNCAVLGVTINNITAGYNFLESMISSLGVGLGFLLAMVVFCGVRSKIEEQYVPKAFRGLPIYLMAASILALTLFAF